MAKLAVVLLLLVIAVYECTAINSVCRLPRDTGPCRAAIRRYYYDQRSGRCRGFIYGGCRGNGNNFRTVRDCRRRCNRAPTCPRGMIFISCGTMCPGTCANPNPRFCTRGCRRGCFCPKGLLLFGRRCVRRSQCPTTRCPPGMIFKKCGTTCPRTCANPNPRFCTKNCRRGCFCPKGLLLFGRRCVRRSQCPTPTCPRGMIFKSCGTACPRTCANPNPRFCTKNCRRGCFCPKRLLLSGKRCVRRSQCPRKCTRGTVYKICERRCRTTCGNSKVRCRTRSCRRGCFCPKPRVWHKGKCVKLRQCPRRISVCFLRPVRGRCKGRIPRYYYNKQLKSCVRFSYSGCGGNKNNFRTIGKCLRACGSRQNQDLLDTDLASEESEDDPAVEESEDDPAVEESEEDPAVEESEDDPAVEESEDDLAVEESEDDPAVEESEDDPAVAESEDDLAVEESEDDPAVEESEDDLAVEEHVDTDSQFEEIDEDENLPEEEVEKESFF